MDGGFPTYLHQTGLLALHVPYFLLDAVVQAKFTSGCRTTGIFSTKKSIKVEESLRNPGGSTTCGRVVNFERLPVSRNKDTVQGSTYE